MNPGEYEVNGIRYGWAHDLDEYEHRERIDGVWFRCARFPDIEKAEKARQELIEAESEGWVEIDDNARIQRDGSDPQVRHEGGICVWRALTNPIDKRWPKAYRKGREVALEQVRELVEAVESTALHFSMVTVRYDEDAPVECHLLESHDWQRIRDAAWKVKL